jgi:hypothetical protein
MTETKGEDRVAEYHPVSNLEAALGVFNGLYTPGHLDELRAEERA